MNDKVSEINKTRIEKVKTMVKLPINHKSHQMDMFSNFIAPKNDDTVLSNLIHLWDLTPKYYISKRQATKMIKDNNLVIAKNTIYINGEKIESEMKPASIEVNGKLVACFPSEDEELIESVLRKLFIKNGVHAVKPANSWAQYSIRMIQHELKKIGKTRSSNEIKRSLEIMLHCNVLIKRDGQTIHNAGILLNQLDKSNQDYANTSNLESAVQLPQFISFSINKMEYIQYNQLVTDSLKSQIARWLTKKLNIEFTNADYTNQYEIKYSTILTESCLLAGTKYKNIIKIDNAILDMVNNNILSDQQNIKTTKKNIYKDQTIIDIEYSLIPSHNFILNMKAANKRNGLLIGNKLI